MSGRGLRELKRAAHAFLEGVEETASQTGLKENVGIVEFNSKARIVQSLTNDYRKCHRAIDSLNSTGQTAMFDGLMASLQEIMSNGGILRIAGVAMTPRIILMTDGNPTDSTGEEEAKKKVLAAAVGFGPKWKEIGLPHPVPIACVGCGECDVVLLQLIAKITNGMYAIVDNVEELSTFFKRQVLLIRFAAKFASDMERLRSQVALAAFLEELGEAVEAAELAALQQLLLAMLVIAISDDDSSESGPPTTVGTTPRAIEAAPARGPQQPSTALVPAPTSRTPQQRQPTTLAPSSGAVLRQQEVRQVRSADGSQAVVVRQQEVSRQPGGRVMVAERVMVVTARQEPTPPASRMGVTARQEPPPPASRKCSIQ
ncbi:hypothetical protein EMCRGX_G028981 [Ephydatia muelleri]